MKAPRPIAPLAAAAALLAAVPAAQAATTARTTAAGAPQALRSVPEPMQFPGDASASAVRAAPGRWLVGARPGAGARTVARAFGARLIGGGDYDVSRGKARAMASALRSRGLLLYAQPDALRPTKQAVPDDPLSKSPDAWRAAIADPNLAPPAVGAASPLIALLDTRLDETAPRVRGLQHPHARRRGRWTTSTAPRPPRSRPHPRTASGSSASGPAPARSTCRSRPTR